MLKMLPFEKRETFGYKNENTANPGVDLFGGLVWCSESPRNRICHGGMNVIVVISMLANVKLRSTLDSGTFRQHHAQLDSPSQSSIFCQLERSS